MALPQVLIDALALINTSTNNLATVVRGLRDQLKTTMTQADVDALKSSLDAVATTLDGIAADPVNPVPTP